MANYKLNQTGEQIQNVLNLIDSNTATSGQVLTADGNGGASWQNASGGGGGGTQLYIHTISVNETDTIYLIDRKATKYTDLSDELKESLAENTKYLIRNGLSVVPLFAEVTRPVMPGQSYTLTTYFLLNKAFKDFTIDSFNSDNVTPL